MTWGYGQYFGQNYKEEEWGQAGFLPVRPREILSGNSVSHLKSSWISLTYYLKDAIHLQNASSIEIIFLICFSKVTLIAGKMYKKSAFESRISQDVHSEWGQASAILCQILAKICGIVGGFQNKVMIRNKCIIRCWNYMIT